jgi:hypothetical protein
VRWFFELCVHETHFTTPTKQQNYTQAAALAAAASSAPAAAAAAAAVARRPSVTMAAAATEAPPAPVLPYRVGHGFDLHRLAEGHKLIIGGVEIPHTKGCEAHSDGEQPWQRLLSLSLFCVLGGWQGSK